MYNRREKGSAAAEDVVTIEKGSPVASEKKTRHKGSKHKKFKNPSVVAKDSSEAEKWKLQYHEDNSGAGVISSRNDASSSRDKVIVMFCDLLTPCVLYPHSMTIGSPLLKHYDYLKYVNSAPLIICSHVCMKCRAAGKKTKAHHKNK